MTNNLQRLIQFNHLKFMKKFAFLSVALLLIACGSNDSAPGAGAPGKGAAGKGGSGGKGGRPAREIAVEGYIAEAHEQGKLFTAMATLEPMNSVSLTAAASGRLVNLYAKDGAQVQKGALLAKIDDSELRAQLKQANRTSNWPSRSLIVLRLFLKKMVLPRLTWKPPKQRSSRRKPRWNSSRLK